MTYLPDIPGIFAVDKPLGMSSARAVAVVKRWARVATGDRNVRVGHGGTLDPLATGVLVVAVGRAYTRTLADAVAADKEYEAVVRLGATSPTDDAEGPVVPMPTGAPVPTEADILAALPAFTGTVLQRPPVFSALKSGGVPHYRRARRGEDVAIAARPVVIYAIDMIGYAYPDIVLRVRCGKGTYIRALARDLGAALGTGAYLAALRRTRVGEFEAGDAWPLDGFRVSADSGTQS